MEACSLSFQELKYKVNETNDGTQLISCNDVFMTRFLKVLSKLRQLNSITECNTKHVELHCKSNVKYSPGLAYS